VRRQITLAQVRFDFDNPPPRPPMHHYLAQQIPRDIDRFPRVELATENRRGPGRSQRLL
jgi:hypothetical protein